MMSLNKFLLQHAVGLTAPSVRKALLEDRSFSRDAGYRTTRTISFMGMPFDATRLAREMARLYRSEKSIIVRAESGVEATFAIDPADKWVICDAPNRKAKLPQLGVFSPDAPLRISALNEVPEFGGLLPDERGRWQKLLTRQAATAASYNRLLDALKATPVAHALRLASPDKNPIRLDEFVPADEALMRRTIGSYSRQERTFAGALSERRNDWAERDGPFVLELALSTAVRADMGLGVPDEHDAAARLAQRVTAIVADLDAFSRVAAIEFLCAAAVGFPELEEMTRSAIIVHQGLGDRLEDELKIFGGVFLMAQAALSTEATREASWRHRRGYAWVLACSAARGLVGRINASDFFQWAYTELGHRYRIAVALDKAAAPRWGWSDGDPGQLRNEVMGRLFVAASRAGETAERIGLSALIEAERARAEKDGSFPFWLMAAPLEGEAPARRSDHRVPQKLERSAIKRLKLADSEQAFAGAANIGRVKIPRPALVRTALERLERVTAEDMLDEAGQLRFFPSAMVHFASVAASAPIADRLTTLYTTLAPKAGPALANAIVHNLLECASVVKKDRTQEADFAQAMRRVISELTNPDAALQCESLLREILRHRPAWRRSLMALIAGSELAQ